jgi:hypothetical protein
MSRSTATLSDRNPESAGISRDSFCNRGHDKKKESLQLTAKWLIPNPYLVSSSYHFTLIMRRDITWGVETITLNKLRINYSQEINSDCGKQTSRHIGQRLYVVFCRSRVQISIWGEGIPSFFQLYLFLEANGILPQIRRRVHSIQWSFVLTTNLTHFFNVFILLLYLFRAIQCSSSGESIVSIHHLVYTEWYIPDDVLIQLTLLMMSTGLLEISREVKQTH